jgi:hypothetical protein
MWTQVSSFNMLPRLIEVGPRLFLDRRVGGSPPQILEVGFRIPHPAATHCQNRCFDDVMSLMRADCYVCQFSSPQHKSHQQPVEVGR